MRIYNQWAGNESGVREDPNRCIVAVFQRGRYVSVQCSRKRGNGPDGLYCKQHGAKAVRGHHLYVPEERVAEGSADR